MNFKPTKRKIITSIIIASVIGLVVGVSFSRLFAPSSYIAGLIVFVPTFLIIIIISYIIYSLIQSKKE